MICKRSYLFSVAVLLAPVFYQAARPQNAAQRPKTEPGKAEVRFVDIKASPIEHNDATGLGQGRNVLVIDGETRIRGDEGKWNKKTKQAEATGNLLLTDPEADGTCEKGEIYWAKSKRLVILTGNVTITVKPKQEKTQQAPEKQPSGPAPIAIQNGKAQVQSAPPPDEDEENAPRKHPAVITCDKVEYQYAKDKKYGKLTGHFKVVQKLKDRTRTITAEHAEWFGLEERLVLHPPVKFEDSKGDSGQSEGIVQVFTKEGDERIITKEMALRIRVEEDEEERPGDKKPPAGGDKKPGDKADSSPADKPKPGGSGP